VDYDSQNDALGRNREAYGSKVFQAEAEAVRAEPAK
jgi:hypothetical protein